MQLDRLEFGSLLSYSPHGIGNLDKQSRSVTYFIKQDTYVKSPPNTQSILMSDLIAQTVKRRMPELEFASIFDGHPLFVPTPSSSLKKANSLDVANRIATALGKELGCEVNECLKRVIPLPKSATSMAANRSKADRHFASLEVQKPLYEPKSIVLIDDVVTRGATLLGAANRLLATYPDCSIKAFTAMRTMSNPKEFKTIEETAHGTILLTPNGGTWRKP
jgi:hypothetical protein